MNAILVVVLLASAGNPPYMKHYAVSSMEVCREIVAKAVLLPPGNDDRRGVQAMFCIEAKP